jgi:uroporphyrin-III C-methyltransferase/precorrin-2 dehydrogenase/sirohydrochlorin ferrochelatase
MTLFPVFLKLANRPVLLVGGGAVASSKLAALQQAGARVTVIAPEINEAIAASGVRVRRRRFRSGDLTGQWLIVSAATPAVNRQVARAAERRRIFVNAVDDPQHASAYLGGVIRRSGVTVAVSTDGEAPALAGLLREGLDALLPSEIDEWLHTAQRVRPAWRANAVPMNQRRPLLLRELNRIYDSLRTAKPPRQTQRASREAREARGGGAPRATK